MKNLPSLKSYCFFIYNEGMAEFSAKDYLAFACKALLYSINGILKIK